MLKAVVKICKATSPGERNEEELLRIAGAVQGSCETLRSLPDDVCARVCQHAELRSCAAGAALFQCGDATDGLYIVVTGEVHVQEQHGIHRTSTNTREPAPSLGRRGVNGLQGTDARAIPKDDQQGGAKPMASRTSLNTFSQTAEKLASASQTRIVLRSFFGADVDEIRRGSMLLTAEDAAKFAAQDEATNARKIARQSVRLQQITEVDLDATPLERSVRDRIHLISDTMDGVESTCSVKKKIKVKPCSSTPENPGSTFGRSFTSFGTTLERRILDPIGEGAASPSPKSPESASESDADPDTVASAHEGLQDFRDRAEGGSADTASEPVRLKEGDGDDDLVTTAVARQGDCVGEAGVLGNAPRRSVARAVSFVEVIWIPAEQLCDQAQAAREHILLQCVKSLPLLGPGVVSRVAALCRLDRWHRGAVLCGEGDVTKSIGEGARLKILAEGTAHVSCRACGSEEDVEGGIGGLKGGLMRRRRRHGQDVPIGTLLPGQLVNGASQLLGELEPCAVTATSEVRMLTVLVHDLQSRTPQGVLETLRGLVEDQHTWRSDAKCKARLNPPEEGSSQEAHSAKMSWPLLRDNRDLLLNRWTGAAEEAKPNEHSELVELRGAGRPPEVEEEALSMMSTVGRVTDIMGLSERTRISQHLKRDASVIRILESQSTQSSHFSPGDAQKPDLDVGTSRFSRTGTPLVSADTQRQTNQQEDFPLLQSDSDLADWLASVGRQPQELVGPPRPGGVSVAGLEARSKSPRAPWRAPRPGDSRASRMSDDRPSRMSDDDVSRMNRLVSESDAGSELRSASVEVRPQSVSDLVGLSSSSWRRGSKQLHDTSGALDVHGRLTARDWSKAPPGTPSPRGPARDAGDVAPSPRCGRPRGGDAGRQVLMPLVHAHEQRGARAEQPATQTPGRFPRSVQARRDAEPPSVPGASRRLLRSVQASCRRGGRGLEASGALQVRSINKFLLEA